MVNITDVMNQQDSISTKKFTENINQNFANLNSGLDELQMDLGTLQNNLEINNLKATLLNLIYPVGSYYWSSNNSSPADFIGGTWTQVKDVFILAAGDTYSVSTKAKDGGSATVKLSSAQVPLKQHTHNNIIVNTGGSGTGLGFARGQGSALNGTSNYTNYIQNALDNNVTAHENMPPYKVAYCWCRTA